jgi:hypothetical protein
MTLQVMYGAKDVFSMDGKRRILIVSFFDYCKEEAFCSALKSESGDGSAIHP